MVGHRPLRIIKHMVEIQLFIEVEFEFVAPPCSPSSTSFAIIPVNKKNEVLREGAFLDLDLGGLRFCLLLEQSLNGGSGGRHQ